MMLRLKAKLQRFVMNHKFLVIAGTVFIILLLSTLKSTLGADALYYQQPYFYFNDNGITRACIPGNEPNDPAVCITDGIKIECISLDPKDGYIDCRRNAS